MKTFQITIDKKKVKARQGQTILEVAKDNGIDIPSLCYHPDLTARESCRLCVVEIKGNKNLQTSCATKAEPGMAITTNSAKIRKARKINLELIFAQHCEECNDCVWSFNCNLLGLANKNGVKITRFEDRKKGYHCYQFGPSVFYDSSKCIGCGNCVEICKKQGVSFLEVEHGEDGFPRLIPSKDPKKDCIYCGQCIVRCPVGALEAVGEFEDVEKPLLDKKKTVVFQFAPSIRSSIGEEFGMAPGEVVIEKMVAGIKALGVDKVFDTCVGADFTTYEEAKELLEKKKKGCGPCLSSCCPAWVKFVEFNYPELIPNIATTRSPQIILGGLIKTYWAKKEGVDPSDITVVSVMPCTSKKYEIKRRQNRVNGLDPVDYVLTTRELAYLFKKNKINLKKIKPRKLDNPLGLYSGAAVIYGASGGVAESALRTAYYFATKKNLKNVNLKQVRGMEGIKKAEVNLGSAKAKIAVVNGISNAIKIIEEIKKNPKAYDAVEVMACYGGCIGGGGQPVYADAGLRKKRAESLYRLDSKAEVRFAHENPVVKQVYKEFLSNKYIAHKVCHTSYSKKNKEVKFDQDVPRLQTKLLKYGKRGS